MNDEILTQARLKEILNYDPDTGCFRWKVNLGQRARIGKVAGSFDRSQGYMRIQINRLKHRNHRLAFLYMTGFMPEQVDHINRIRSDNRWCNLRAANNSINQKNSPKRKDNASGVTGVHWQKSDSVWIAYISTGGNRIYLGCFSDKTDAIAARKEADIKYGFHENHGKQLGVSRTTVQNALNAKEVE